MKFCIKCGTKMEDGVAVCPNCQTPANYTHGHHSDEAQPYNVDTGSVYDAKIKTFMIIRTIIFGLLIIPLLWHIPLTASVSRRLEHNEKISAGYKVVILIFGSLVAGIMLFARKDPKKEEVQTTGNDNLK